MGPYCSYLLPKQAGGTPQTFVDKTLRMTSRPALKIHVCGLLRLVNSSHSLDLLDSFPLHAGFVLVEPHDFNPPGSGGKVMQERRIPFILPSSSIHSAGWRNRPRAVRAPRPPFH